jgi:predicted NodU family carbamoyl transferase
LDAEEEIIEFLMQDCAHLKPQECELLKHCPYYNAGLDSAEFRNFAGIVSDRIFDRFYRFAESHMKRRMPLLITGVCGLNCDWNTKWRQTDLFSEVFVPPVANDSGSAIGRNSHPARPQTSERQWRLPRCVWSAAGAVGRGPVGGWVGFWLFDVSRSG